MPTMVMSDLAGMKRSASRMEFWLYMSFSITAVK